MQGSNNNTERPPQKKAARLKGTALHQQLQDPHFLIALVAALPIWAVLYGQNDIYNHSTLSISMLLALLLIYPILEELCFRGLLQGWLLQQTVLKNRSLLKIKALACNPTSYTNILTSIAFAGCHWLVSPQPASLLVFFPSLVFGYLRERQQSLATPILLHIVYNSGFALMLALR